MTKDKNLIGVDFTHPDLTHETGLDFFSNHEATENYRSAFQELDEINEITVFHIIKTFILSSIEITIRSKNTPKQIDPQNSIDDLLFCIKKSHIIDDDVIDLVELTMILEFYRITRGESTNHLQDAIENKFLPKTPTSQNKKKASNYLRFAATYFAILLEESGASKRQAIALSCELFGFSETFIKIIYSDVIEVKGHPELNHYLPISDLIDGLILHCLYERREKLENIRQEFQNPNMRSNKVPAKHKTIKSFINMLINKGSAAYDKVSKEEREVILKQLPQEFPKHILNLKPSLDDSLDDLIMKNLALYENLLKNHFNIDS